MTAVYNIVVDCGGTFSRTISGVDSSNTNIFASATAANAMIRETPDSNVVATFACSFAANNASLTISLDANTTTNIAIGRGIWDLKITYPNKVTFPIAGNVTVNKRVTR